MPQRPQKPQKKSFSSPYLKVPSSHHPQLLCQQMAASYSAPSPGFPHQGGPVMQRGRSWESRMGGCEHPPGHKEAAGEEDAPAPPCEARHRNGQWGDGSLLRQLCPPKPSLLPDRPPHWPSTPTLGLLKAFHRVRAERRWGTPGPKVTVAARCKTYRATLAPEGRRGPQGGRAPGRRAGSGGAGISVRTP